MRAPATNAYFKKEWKTLIWEQVFKIDVARALAHKLNVRLISLGLLINAMLKTLSAIFTQVSRKSKIESLNTSK